MPIRANQQRNPTDSETIEDMDTAYELERLRLRKIACEELLIRTLNDIDATTRRIEQLQAQASTAR